MRSEAAISIAGILAVLILSRGERKPVPTPAAKEAQIAVAENLPLFELVNRRRSAFGVKTLAVDPSLIRAATESARTQAERGACSAGSDYDTEQLVRWAGYDPQSAHEMVSEGWRSGEKMLAAMMGEMECRRDILNSQYTQMGYSFAHAKGPDGTLYWSIIMAVPR